VRGQLSVWQLALQKIIMHQWQTPKRQNSDHISAIYGNNCYPLLNKSINESQWRAADRKFWRFGGGGGRHCKRRRNERWHRRHENPAGTLSSVYPSALPYSDYDIPEPMSDV
jgi:hypothetical protein